MNKRLEVLEKLKSIIQANEELIANALKKDLGKCSFEAYISEIDFCVNEIDYHLKKLKKWMKPEKVGSPLHLFPARSYIYSEPYGKVLVIAPWNYPFQLLMAPVIGALSAGNAVVAKPSEIAVATSEVIEKIINENFDPDVLKVVTGGIPETTALLNQKFDYIFYTGNGFVGRIILEKAAKNLTPVTLELGGKSPCFVYTKELELSAKRIMWGKFFNSGQTCVAPDYVIIAKKDRDEFIRYCGKWLKVFYGEKAHSSPDYSRIISDKHFERLVSYLEDENILIGGSHHAKERFIEPTLIEANTSSKAMQEEIFGPILPIITQDSLGAAISFSRGFEKPLAAYAFVDSSKDTEMITSNISAGGMVINDTIVHLANHKLPFGGVGESGMGGYHGKFSFDLFSHKKAVIKRSFLFENNLRYPPYGSKLNSIRKIIKFLTR